MREEKSKSILLGLRNNNHKAQLIVLNGANKPVLGTNDPEEEQRRVDIVKHWSGGQESPRQQVLTGIKQALDQRTQTILYYRLTNRERQQINSGSGLLSKSRNNKNDVCNADLPHSEE